MSAKSDGYIYSSESEVEDPPSYLLLEELLDYFDFLGGFFKLSLETYLGDSYS